MSLVGPRPAAVWEIEYNQRRLSLGILDTLPGITGWTQVNGRKTIPPDKKVEMEIWYRHNWSYWLDLKIILKTFVVVLIDRTGAV